MRVGMGYDVHRLTEGRDLILGGVKIPYEKGLLGHSDADVLLHAIMDALLGAAALGDIGKHFPDTDEKYSGISSMKLLKHVAGLLEENLYIVENIDATIIAQKPKMRPHIAQMEENIARCWNAVLMSFSTRVLICCALPFVRPYASLMSVSIVGWRFVTSVSATASATFIV